MPTHGDCIPSLIGVDRGLTIVSGNSEWCGSMLVPIDLAEFQLVGLRAQMGTGKTEAVASRWKGKKVVAVAHRVSLVHSLAGRLGTDSYDDVRWTDHAAKVDHITHAERLATTVQSLHKLADRTWNGSILIIDEVTQVLRTLGIGPRGHHPGRGHRDGIAPHRRDQLLRILLRAMREADQVWLLDAHLEWWHFDLLSSLSEIPLEDCILLKNARVPARSDAIEYPTRGALLDSALAISEAGERVLWTTSSRNNAMEVAKRLREAGRKTLLVTAETREVAAVENWLRDPQGAGTTYDVVVASPSIGTGISLDTAPDGSPMFPHVFHHGHLHGLHMDDHLQAIHRVRGAPRLHWWCSRRRSAKKNPPPSPLAIGQGLKQRLVESGHLVEGLAGVQGGPDPQLRRWLPLLALHGQVEHDRRMSICGGHHTMAKRLQLAGWTVKRCPPAAETDAQKAERQAVRAALLDERLKRVRSATLPPGPDADVAEIAHWNSLSAEDKAAGKEAAMLLDTLALEELPTTDGPELDAIVWAIDERKLCTLPLAELVLGGDACTHAAEADLHEFGYERVGQLVRRWRDRAWSPVDLRHNMMRRQLVVSAIKAAGGSPEMLLSGPGMTYDKKSLAGFVAWASPQSKELKALVDVTAPTANGASRSFRTLMERLGCEPAKGPRLANGGHSYVAVLPEHLRATLKRRCERTNP